MARLRLFMAADAVWRPTERVDLWRTQWAGWTHPNLGAALMVGLVEVFQIDRMKDEYGMVEGDLPKP